ncbi:hypothetical protein J6590_100608 [Homalodisca vitripennis]|nr:hypothetical protein J6590_100608 [Homalodisca vitripennis]
MAERSKTLDFESELEIAQARILSVTVALFISTIDLVLYRLSPLFCLIRSSHRPTELWNIVNRPSSGDTAVVGDVRWGSGIVIRYFTALHLDLSHSWAGGYTNVDLQLDLSTSKQGECICARIVGLPCGLPTKPPTGHLGPRPEPFRMTSAWSLYLMDCSCRWVLAIPFFKFTSASCDKAGPEKSGTGVRSRTETLPQFPGARPPYSQHRKPDVPGADRSNAKSDLCIHGAFLTRARRGWLLVSYQRKHHRQCKAHISPCDNQGHSPGSPVCAGRKEGRSNTHVGSSKRRGGRD